MCFFVCFVQEVQFESPVCGFSKYIYSVSQVLKEHFPLKKKKGLCTFWQVIGSIHFSLHQVSSSSLYFLYIFCKKNVFEF